MRAFRNDLQLYRIHMQVSTYVNNQTHKRIQSFAHTNKSTAVWLIHSAQADLNEMQREGMTERLVWFSYEKHNLSTLQKHLLLLLHCHLSWTSVFRMVNPQHLSPISPSSFYWHDVDFPHHFIICVFTFMFSLPQLYHCFKQLIQYIVFI